jgi:sugar lactone lactonase YvrE
MIWSDISAGTLHRSPIAGSSDGSDDDVRAFGPPLSALAVTNAGDYLLAFVDTIALVSTGGSLIRRVATIPHRHDGMRFNEGKCDPSGRFIVGSMDYDGTADGAIYSVTADGEWRILIAGLGVANGFEWSDAGDRMWFADTSVQTIYVGDYSDDGELTNVEPFLRGHTFDGLARDADGGFWAGINGEGTVMRFDAEGATTCEVAIPADHVTAVAFGDDDLSTLFIATAREKLSEHELQTAPLSGSIFSFATRTHGHAPHLFDTQALITTQKENHDGSRHLGP